MSLESELFINLRPDYKKLNQFGFKKEGNFFTFSQTIPNTDLLIKIEINSNQQLSGKIIDTNFNEEYINFRSSASMGSFSNSIRNDYQKLLSKIAADCFIFDPVNTGQEWIVPANPKYFNLEQGFSNKQTIIWKQSMYIKIGDIVYLYVAAPISALKYKCLVTNVNQPYHYHDQNVSMTCIMKLRYVGKLDTNKYKFNNLKKYGIKAIRGPRHAPKALIDAISQDTKN